MHFDKKFSITELAIQKVKKGFVPIMSKLNLKRINNTDFTIISNNCWGGYVTNILG